MAARFILSLDCEGKWGVADQLTGFERAHSTDEKLRQAYSGIINLLDDFSIPATFAFVGLFAEPRAELKKLRPELDALALKSPNYLGAALREIDSGSAEGWHGAWAVEQVGAAPVGHEIALHGITHVPWGHVSRDFAIAELALHGSLSSPVKSAVTFVAPRNEVAHVDLLETIGIEGYRQSPSHRSRAASFLSEFNLWQQPQDDAPRPPRGPVPIPSGFFVNWRHGLRRMVPVAVTEARVRHLLEAASGSDRLVHLWLHPENIATAPRTLDLLTRLLRMVADRRDQGRCAVLTQRDYLERLNNEERSPALRPQPPSSRR